MTSAPLPGRILLPLANPRTAADLVRIGAALLQHGGSLTALGIVEVAEGVPLSEGATRARQARRLLQRVLDFAPAGVELHTVVRIGRRAAEGIIELAAEEESDLIIFGWGGRPGGKRGTEAVFSPTIDEVVRDAPCNIAVVKQRGVVACSASLLRCAADRTPSWPSPTHRLSAATSKRRWMSCTSCHRTSARWSARRPSGR